LSLNESNGDKINLMISAQPIALQLRFLQIKENPAVLAQVPRAP
jgi:hypothetical protein